MRIKEMDVVLLLVEKMPREWQLRSVRRFMDFVDDWQDEIAFDIDEQTWTESKLEEMARRFDVSPTEFKKKSRR